MTTQNTTLSILTHHFSIYPTLNVLFFLALSFKYYYFLNYFMLKICISLCLSSPKQKQKQKQQQTHHLPLTATTSHHHHTTTATHKPQPPHHNHLITAQPPPIAHPRKNETRPLHSHHPPQPNYHNHHTWHKSKPTWLEGIVGTDHSDGGSVSPPGVVFLASQFRWVVILLCLNLERSSITRMLWLNATADLRNQRSPNPHF